MADKDLYNAVAADPDVPLKNEDIVTAAGTDNPKEAVPATAAPEEEQDASKTATQIEEFQRQQRQEAVDNKTKKKAAESGAPKNAAGFNAAAEGSANADGGACWSYGNSVVLREDWLRNQQTIAQNIKCINRSLDAVIKNAITKGWTNIYLEKGIFFKSTSPVAIDLLNNRIQQLQGDPARLRSMGFNPPEKALMHLQKMVAHKVRGQVREVAPPPAAAPSPANA